MPKWRRHLSRIAIRLMAFNFLLVILPIAGILYLDVYEDHLVASQKRAMFGHAEIIASAIESSDGENDDVRALVEGLDVGADTRVRVVDGEGRVTADTGRPEVAVADQSMVRRSFLYRVGSFLLREPLRLLRRAEAIPAGDHYDEVDRLEGEEVSSALRGEPGEAKRLTSSAAPAVVLYSAVPISGEGGSSVGAVVVSQTTNEVLQDLYEVRLGIFRIFLVAVLGAMIISLWIATTIVRPIHRLREEAGMILDRRGRLRGSFRGSIKQDEIGDLSRALERLTSRLDAHQAFSESFASDVSHEFKNPLASIRNATEMLSEVHDPGERRRFLDVVEREVARMEHLLSALRDVTLIDARLPGEQREPVDLSDLLESIIDGFDLRERGKVHFRAEFGNAPIMVRASRERLVQVFENLLDNAVSFSPPGGTILIESRKDADVATVTIRDEGPGFPDANHERVFDRFFTYRPHEKGRDLHTGLGLAIVRAIVEGYGGEVTLRNRPEGGATAVVVLPLT